MSNPTSFPGDLVVPGNLRISGSISPGMARSDILAMAELQAFAVPWTAWRTFDAMGTTLPSAAANDDLGLVGGTHGTNHVSIQAGDVGEANSVRYARAVIAMPWEYVAGQSATLRFYAGCLTAAADTTCTLDIAAYIMDGDNTVGADVAAAAVANNMNSIVFANVDFALTPTNLSAGTELDVLLSITYNDSATAVVTPCIGKVQLLVDVR
jgi:hypothetical protein